MNKKYAEKMLVLIKLLEKQMSEVYEFHPHFDFTQEFMDQYVELGNKLYFFKEQIKINSAAPSKLSAKTK